MTKKECPENCKNCKHFQRYYVISATLSFTPTGDGFCTNYLLKNNLAQKHVQKNEGCELWQPYELKKLKQKYYMEQLLIETLKKIGTLLILFNDEE